MTTNVQIILQAVDQASREIGKVSNSLTGMDKAAGKSASGVNSSLGQIVSIAGATVGAVTAIGVALQQVYDASKQGAAVNQTADSFNRLIDTVGANKDLLNQLRDASKGTVDDMTLMSSTATLLAGTSDELGAALAEAAPKILELAKAANKLNPSLGDTAFLYQSLMTGIKRGSPMLIDNTGITLKLGEANEKMAQSLGKSVEELTSEEQKMAILNATLEAGGNMLRQVGGNTDSATDSFARLETASKNLGDAIKADLAPFLASAVEAIATLWTWNEKVNAAFEDQADKIEKTSVTYEEYVREMILAGIASGKLHENTLKHIETYGLTAESAEYLRKKIGLLSEEEMHAARVSDNLAGAADEMKNIFLKNVGAAQAAGNGIEEYADKADAAAKKLSDAQTNIGLATISLKDAQQNWMDGTGTDVQRALEQAGLKGEAFDKALSAIDTTYGTGLAVQNQYGKDLAAIAAEYKKTGDVQKFKDKLGELKNTYMGLDDSVKQATDKLWYFKLIWDSLQSKQLTLSLNTPNIPGGGGGGGSQYQNPGAGDSGLTDTTVIYDPSTDTGDPRGTRRAAGGPVSGYVMNESAHTRPETLVLGNRNGQVLTRQQAEAALGGGVTIMPGAIVINGAGNAGAVADEVLNRIQQRLGNRARLASVSGSKYQGA